MTENFTAPEGWVATEISEDVIVLKKKDEPQGRSKTWEEFCERHPKKKDESYISSMPAISTDYDWDRQINEDRNLIPSRYAKPLLALMQLLTIREKEYIPEGWVPKKGEDCYKLIYQIENDNMTSVEVSGPYGYANRPLVFPTEELADEFLDTWKDLIEEAKILL